MTDDAHCFATKTCPRCGSELYADMRVCYGCLYDFDREAPPPLVARAHVGNEPGVGVRTNLVDLWRPVPPEGLVIGRGSTCDVVLRAPSVSDQHLRICPTPDGMEVTDLGSTNPATYKGRELKECAVVAYGDSIDLCGVILTMTGSKIGCSE